MLLIKADLNFSLYPEISQSMSRYSDAIIDSCLNEADGYLAAYLGARFDIASELAKTGSDRNPFLITLARDIAIYRLYTLLETIPEHRKLLFENAISMLKAMRDGKSPLPGVDPLPTPDPLPSGGQIGFGSNDRRPTLLAQPPGIMPYY